MPLNESNVVERASRLLVCTIDAANFSDKMDVIFVAEMIEKISKFAEKFKDVSGCKSWGGGQCLSRVVYRCCWRRTNELLCSCLLSCCSKRRDIDFELSSRRAD